MILQQITLALFTLLQQASRKAKKLKNNHLSSTLIIVLILVNLILILVLISIITLTLTLITINIFFNINITLTTWMVFISIT